MDTRGWRLCCSRHILLPAIAVATVCTGCFLDNSPSGPNEPVLSERTLFVVGSDFQSGGLWWMGVDDTEIDPDNRLEIYQDSDVRSYRGDLYVLERYRADNIRRYSAVVGSDSAVTLELQYQTHLGDMWNPIDMEFINDTLAYVALENEPTILRFNTATGQAIGSINTSQYTYQNPGGTIQPTSPHAGDMVFVDSLLYVPLQRRIGWDLGDVGLILVVDIATDAVVDTVRMQYRNPVYSCRAGSDIYLSCAGMWETLDDGAIEVFHIDSRTVETVITEQQLGGSPATVQHIEGGRFYVEVYQGWNDVQVKEVDFASGTVVEMLPGITDAFGTIVYDSLSQTLFVGERSPTESGIKVFDRGNTLLDGPLSMPLPPCFMCILEHNP